MKSIFTKSLLAFHFFALISITACNTNNDDDDGNTCTGSLDASWKVNGTEENAYVEYNGHTVSFLSLSFQACTDPNNSVVINYIPYPPSVGAYELRNGPLSSPIQGQGTYVDESVGTSGVHYPTNDTIVGTLNITSVDLTAKTLSGNFSFNALKPDGSTVQITEGQIFDTKYED